MTGSDAAPLVDQVRARLRAIEQALDAADPRRPRSAAAALEDAARHARRLRHDADQLAVMLTRATR
ncbi:hypothetical protein [Actinomadura kijaniata]|uniref:hypothetical protein n=1 Tax=Actinomadura kijaniata TaxID=46161 RepID=UPI00083040FE|nr:hypothetical protein [Actinomadura kijaniata]